MKLNPLFDEEPHTTSISQSWLGDKIISFNSNVAS